MVCLQSPLLMVWPVVCWSNIFWENTHHIGNFGLKFPLVLYDFVMCRKVHEGKFTRGKRWRVVREHLFPSYIINVVDYFLGDRLLCIFLQEFCGWFLHIFATRCSFQSTWNPVCWTKTHFFCFPVAERRGNPTKHTFVARGRAATHSSWSVLTWLAVQENSHVPIAGNTNLAN